MRSIFFQIMLVITIAIPAYGQSDTTDTPYDVSDTLQHDFGLFSNEEILELSLRFDITHYTRKKPKDEYLKAVLTYHINDEDSINKDIKLKSRGEFRNSYCAFPPIRLNFKKADFQMADLKKIETVKLVTHCRHGNEEYLLKEYLMYKLFNVLTDTSFRVRLVKINYINTYKESKPIQTYSFMIEPLNLLAERINATPVDILRLTQKNIDQKMMDRMAIFNYMIGNTDWSVPNQHNCKVLRQQNAGRPDLGMIIPYDFDYSGLVNADYAVPYEGLEIKSVRERLYLGVCRSEEEFLETLKIFSAHKEDFYNVIRGFELLREKSKKEMLLYLDEFYSLFDNNRIVDELIHDCKNF